MQVNGIARLALAGLYLRQGRQTAALAELEPVLATCASEDAPGRILWMGPAIVTPLLQLAREQQVQTALVQRVLHLLATR